MDEADVEAVPPRGGFDEGDVRRRWRGAGELQTRDRPRQLTMRADGGPDGDGTRDGNEHEDAECQARLNGPSQLADEVRGVERRPVCGPHIFLGEPRQRQQRRDDEPRRQDWGKHHRCRVEASHRVRGTIAICSAPGVSG